MRSDRRRRIRSALAVVGIQLSLALAATRAQAQNARPLTPPPEFTVDQWTTVDGLPQNSVNAIAQTPDGYIWVGTFGGLARFDGLRFHLLERVDSAGRHIDRVLCLAVAPDSSVWVGTENGLLHYDGGKFTRFSAADGLPDNQVLSLHFDRAGTLWIGTERGGLTRDIRGTFHAMQAADGVHFDQVVSIVEDKEDVLWLNSRDFFFTVEKGMPTLARARPLASIGLDRMVAEDRNGDRWFRRHGGVVRLDQRGRIDSFNVGGPEVMLAQENGRYWLGTFLNGVREFRPGADGRAQVISHPLRDGTTSYSVRALHDGVDGSVWVGTNKHGLLRLKRNLFTTYKSANGLSHDIMTPVMQARDGSMWVGTNCGGVNVVDSAHRSVKTYRTGRLAQIGTDACVFALAQDSSGAIWVGTYGGGLTRIMNGEARAFAGLKPLRDSVILAMFVDQSGTLWVGTNAAGLVEVRAGTVRHVYTTEQGLAHNSVRFITQSTDGTLWVGTLEGLSLIHPDRRITSYSAKDGLSGEYIRAVYEDTDGTFWIGTYGGGLDRLRDGKFASITSADGLADDVVSSILDDGRGNLWMSGNRGIYRVAKRQLNDFADGKLRRVHSVLYGVGDGLVNAETNGGFQPAAWKDRAGHLWFPTIDGLATVNPAEATDVPRPPSVTMEEIIVDGESQAPDQSLSVGPGRHNVEFRYSGVSLSSPDNVTFRYRLEGFDDNWIEPGTRRVAYYSRLPAGRYRFLVTAANRDGAWNPIDAAMDVVVLAPLYRRPWFIALMLGALALALWTAHRARLRARGAVILEERTRLAREIHDSLLQGFGGIALQLHAASARLSVTDSQRSELDHVMRAVDRTLTQARQAVWDIRPSASPDNDLAVQCEEAARRLLAGTPTTHRIMTRGRKKRLSALAETECLRIVEEALTNVRRHAGAAKVSVDINYRWRGLSVAVADDGKGFDASGDALLPGHWGWLGMRERASRIGARLTLASRPGSGTLVSLDVPYYPWFLGRVNGIQSGSKD